MTMMMLTSAASIGLTAVTFIVYEFAAARREMHDQLVTLARVVAGGSTAALAFRDQEGGREVLATLRSEPQVRAAALYDERGALFATYPTSIDRSRLPEQPAEDGLRFSADYLEGFQTVNEVDERPLGTLYIRADMQPLYQRFGLYGAVAAFVTLGSLLLAYVLSIVLQRRLSRPIFTLAETARAVSERADYSVRAPPAEEGEVGVLTTAFNRMLERIDAQNSGLLESEARLRAVLNSDLSAVILMDARGCIVDWNARAENIFGWAREEALGELLAERIIPERLREAHRDGVRRFLETGRTTMLNRTMEMPALRRNGTEFPIELSISLLPGSAAPTFCGFATDISERKQSRARMQTQLARLDLLQRTTRAIAERQDLHSIYQVVLRSLEGNLPVEFGCMCRYEESSRELSVAAIGEASAVYAARMQLHVGAPLPIDEESLARCVSGALVSEPDLASVPFAFAQQLASIGLRSLVAAPLMVENTLFGVLLTARAGGEGFTSGDCEFLRQLTEHVGLAAHQVQLHTALQQAYDELRQSQQVILQQERLRALGQMASGVAHDINNAISPLALYTESLLEREPALTPQGRSQLQVMQRAIEDVAQTVAKMREFYRRSDQNGALQPVELNLLIQQVLQSTRARWHDMPQERGHVIDVRTELHAQLPPIHGAESDIRDALTNLIFNAVDAMPDGGVLTLRTAASTTANEVLVEVVDSGVGMDEETRRRCLDPFFTTKGERGTGMGLAMVYGMVRRHGAQIDIQSAPGSGTTVRLRFPAASQGAMRETQPAHAAVAPLLRILLVDDDEIVLESLRLVLSSEGHTVETANGGQSGIERFLAVCGADAQFDLVITDLGMPFVDGRAVAEAVKKAAPHIPVFLLTGWGERMRVEHSVPTYIDRVLSKPPRLSELRRVLAEFFSGAKPHPIHQPSAPDSMRFNA